MNYPTPQSELELMNHALEMTNSEVVSDVRNNSRIVICNISREITNMIHEERGQVFLFGYIMFIPLV